ncbi:MAG: porin, partial [Hyphomicrobiales bacterium]
MRIKTLLLSSAAVLSGAMSAQAADAVVMVEPEPAEYVRVCDVYGAGFFYIPGTETCLKVGGYVRARVIVEDKIGNNDLDDAGRDANGDVV